MRPLLVLILCCIIAFPVYAVPPKDGLPLRGQEEYEFSVKGLLRAIENSDHASVTRLLDKGVNINEEEKQTHTTPLQLAIQRDNVPIVKRLLERGADVMQKDVDGTNTLHYAARVGNPAVLQLLCERGMKAHINTPDFVQETPLHLAAARGKTEGVRFLLDQGANPNLGDTDRHTPLMAALESGEKESVKLLLDRGANPDLEDREGWTPLMRIVTRSLTRRGEFFALPLQFHLDLLGLFLAKGANLNLRNHNGETALIIALYWDEEEMAALLEKAGASTKGANEARLFRAIAEGNRKRVLRLLAAGTNPNLRDREMDTPLICAVANGDVYIVRALLAKGADVNARGTHDRTALFGAVGHPEIARLLLDAGTNISLRDSSGDTAFTYALTEGHGNIAVLRILLDRGIDVNGKRGLLSYLTWAAKYGHIGAVRLLLERGADVNAKDSTGNTILHHAIMRRNRQGENLRPVLEALLNAGADINARSQYGITPLMLALEKEASLHPDDIRFLRERGAVGDTSQPSKEKP